MVKKINFHNFIRKDVLNLAIPILIEQLLITLMGFVNALISANIGKEAAAAIGMIDSINNVVIFLFSSFATGVAVVVAHYKGRSDKQMVAKSSSQALFLSLIIGVTITFIFFITKNNFLSLLYGSVEAKVAELSLKYYSLTIFSYPFIAVTLIINGVLRGSGNTRTPAKIMIIINVLNVIFSYLLIYGFNIKLNSTFLFSFNGYGIEGSAIGIGLARVIGAFLVFFILFRDTFEKSIKKVFSFRPDFGIISSICKIGIPTSIESLSFQIGKLISQVFLVLIGTTAIAANYIVSSIHTMVLIPATALNMTIVILIGQYMGNGEKEQAEKMMKYMIKLTTVVVLIPSFIICFLLAPHIAGLFIRDKEIIDIVTMVLMVSLIFMPFWAFSFLLPSGLRGAGDVKYSLIVIMISMWSVRIVLGYLLCVYFNLGVLGIWLAMFFDWIIRGIFFYIRFHNGKWKNKKVIKDIDEKVKFETEID